MPLIKQTIPGLYNGVSQQPSTVRLPTQAEIQENGLSSLVTGLKKRPPTEHVAYVGYNGQSVDNALVHTINRDNVERYVVIITNGDLKVFDIAGVEKTVLFPGGKGYLSAVDPQGSFKVITVADYTFIVNSTVSTAMRADVAPGAVVATHQLFSDLPSVAGEGAIYEIAGDPTNNFDNYFVKRVGGVYVEDIKPGELLGFDFSTMPHTLVRNADGTFTFSSATWDDRYVGDADSSKQPSFIGRKITDIFFHRDRLGVISDENIVFSATGDYFNFWRETVMDVLDSDPIDVSVSHTKVSTLKHAVPFNKALMLFSEQTQFILTASDALTPKSVKVDQVTEFETSQDAKPIGSGPNVYFIVERGNYAGVKEYYVSEDTLTNDAADVTKHVPTYIKSGVFKLAASSNEDLLFALTSTERNALYVYKYYWQGEEKKQSSWSKWVFGSTDVILNVDVIGTKLYLVIARADGVFLEALDFQEELFDDVGYLVHLDRKVEVTGVYSPATQETTWTLPYDEPDDLQLILGVDFGADSGGLLNTTKVTDGTLKTSGDYSAGPVYIGRKYTLLYRFSEQSVKTDGLSVLNSKLQLRGITLDFVSSGNFDIVVQAKGRNAYTYPYTGRVLGSGNLLLGSPHIDSGRFRATVMANSQEVNIEIINDSPMPSAFQSAEWEGYYVQRAGAI